MYYEITISKNGKHFFATAERSITTEEKLAIIMNEFTLKFPASEGYQITITKWDKRGIIVKW